MRERENKRKANLKKKVEREEREREARARMNIPSPIKGFYVGPSQIRLSGFLGTGVKRKRGEVQPSTENKDKETLEIAKSEDQKLEITERKAPEPEMATTEKPKSQKPECTKHSLQQMAPPNSRAPLQPRSANPIIPPKPLFFAEPAKLSIAIEDDWDSFLASNTQIEQELAGPDTTTKVPTASPPPARPFLIPVNDTTDILDMILTQDLDYTDDNVPVEPRVPNLESDAECYSKAASVSRDEVKKECIHGHENECRYTVAQARKELSYEGSGKSESDYGDDAGYELDLKVENIDEICLSNDQRLGVNQPDKEPGLADMLPNDDYGNDSPTLSPNPQNSDFDFDDGIKDSEFQTLIADYETNQPHSSPPSDTHTPPCPAPPHISGLERSDYGDFELSTQDTRELLT